MADLDRGLASRRALVPTGAPRVDPVADAQARVAELLARVGALDAEVEALSAGLARFAAELSPHSSVSEPPSPPAPFTFHPSAPCSFAIAMTLRASVPTRAEWSRPCASVLSVMARPRPAKSPAERASRERGAVRRSSTMAGESGPALSSERMTASWIAEESWDFPR